MSTDDHGLETIRKSGEEVTPGDKSDYYIKSKLLGNGNTELELSVNSSNQLKVVLDGKVDTGNSRNTILLANAEFTGTVHETLDYAMIFVTVFSNVASATDGLHIDISSDGITWRQGDVYTIPAGVEKTFSFQPNKKYYRIHYINGGSDQTVFDLHTILKKTNSKPSSHRIQDAISTEDDATLSKAVITALDDTNTFINLTATNSGNLKVANVENGLSIAQGNVTGTTYVNKFGNTPDFDLGDDPTVWDGADDGGIDEMRYNYSTSAIIDSISSSVDADTQDIEIQGLDSDYNIVVQTITLTGRTRKALDTNLIRVFRMKNVNSTDNAGHVYCFEDTPLALGTPILTNKVRAVIQPLNNQTLMAVYTIPNGVTGYMRSWYGSIAGANKSSNYIIELRAREQGQVFQLKHISSLSDGGSSYGQHIYVEPEKFTAKTDIEMRVALTAGGATAASFSAGFDLVLINN